MIHWRFAKIAARLMAETPRGVPTVPPPPDEEREGGILALRKSLRARRQGLRRRRIFNIVGAGAAVAAAATLILAVLNERSLIHLGKSRGVQETHSQVIRAWGTEHDGVDLPDGTAVRVGNVLVAHRPDGARLSFSSGTELRLKHHARIDVKATGDMQRFGLTHGRLHAEVAPLSPGQRFVIETPDGEIEVHGTVFELAVVSPQSGCAVPTRTRLTVSHGVVEVRAAGRRDLTRAGEHWPPECDALADASVGGVPSTVGASAPARNDSPQPPAPPRRSIQREVAAGGRTTAAPPSDLAVQNDLFAAAMAAKSRGATSRALAALDDLIGRFPRGPLAEAAHIERFRLSRQAGDGPAARRLAREYLHSFPDGLARSEAHVVLGAAP